MLLTVKDALSVKVLFTLSVIAIGRQCCMLRTTRKCCQLRFHGRNMQRRRGCAGLCTIADDNSNQTLLWRLRCLSLALKGTLLRPDYERAVCRTG